MENTLQNNDVVFRSDLLKTILSRAGSYVIGILSAYILPYLFQEGFSGILNNVKWDTIKQVSISIIIVLLVEAGLRYILYEISRMRANNDLRDKAIILPKGVKLKDVLPFTVTNYRVKYSFTPNKSDGLDMTREESATVLGGNSELNELKFGIHDFLPRFTKKDVLDPKKTIIEFETLPGSHLNIEGDPSWEDNNNSLLYVTTFNDTIGPNSNKTLDYHLKVTAIDYITPDIIAYESIEHVNEKVILEVKDITIEVEFPTQTNFNGLDFEAIGKSNVLLEALVDAIKNNNNFTRNVGKLKHSITINSPVPDVKYGFTWQWKKTKK